MLLKNNIKFHLSELYITFNITFYSLFFIDLIFEKKGGPLKKSDSFGNRLSVPNMAFHSRRISRDHLNF